MPNVDCNLLGKEADFNVTRDDPSIVGSASCCEDRNWIPEVVNDESYSENSVELFRGGTSEFKDGVSSGRFPKR